MHGRVGEEGRRQQLVDRSQGHVHRHDAVGADAPALAADAGMAAADPIELLDLAADHRAEELRALALAARAELGLGPALGVEHQADLGLAVDALLLQGRPHARRHLDVEHTHPAIDHGRRVMGPECLDEAGVISVLDQPHDLLDEVIIQTDLVLFQDEIVEDRAAPAEGLGVVLFGDGLAGTGQGLAHREGNRQRLGIEADRDRIGDRVLELPVARGVVDRRAHLAGQLGHVAQPARHEDPVGVVIVLRLAVRRLEDRRARPGSNQMHRVHLDDVVAQVVGLQVDRLGERHEGVVVGVAGDDGRRRADILERDPGPGCRVAGQEEPRRRQDLDVGAFLDERPVRRGHLGGEPERVDLGVATGGAGLGVERHPGPLRAVGHDEGQPPQTVRSAGHETVEADPIVQPHRAAGARRAEPADRAPVAGDRADRPVARVEPQVADPPIAGEAVAEAADLPASRQPVPARPPLPGRFPALRRGDPLQRLPVLAELAREPDHRRLAGRLARAADEKELPDRAGRFVDLGHDGAHMV